MSKRKKKIVSMQKAIYLIINEELSDIDLKNSGEEDYENVNNVQDVTENQCTNFSTLDLGTVGSSGNGCIPIGDKVIEVEIENLDK